MQIKYKRIFENKTRVKALFKVGDNEGQKPVVSWALSDDGEVFGLIPSTGGLMPAECEPGFIGYVAT
jgi:hypothetical protein